MQIIKNNPIEIMKTITSIGEILFDDYPSGKKLGGAPFNFFYHISHLTGDGNFISRIGKDDMGKEIVDFFNKHELATTFLQIDNTLLTGVAVPILNEQRMPEWIIKDNRAYDAIEINDDIISVVRDSDCLYFGTLAQRDIRSRSSIQALFDKRIKFFCDLNLRQNYFSKDIVELSLKTANVLKLNVDELHLVNTLIYENKIKSTENAETVLNDYNLELLGVTSGENGAIIYGGSKKNSFNYPVKNVVDTVGAGDAYSAIFCLGYLNGWDIERINILACEFAAGIVKIIGALPNDLSFYQKYREIIYNE
jgi:fructokinase